MVNEPLTEKIKNLADAIGIDVLGYKGEVVDKKIVRFKAHVKIAFTVKRQ